MGLAFGMCGYPKEGGDKHLPQNLLNHCHYWDSMWWETNRAGWSHPATPGCADRMQAEFSDWKQRLKLPKTFG